jgi:phage terminase large subunit-like protein
MGTTKIKHSSQAVVDATGVGDAFVEQLGRSGANIYPFKIQSNNIKRTLIEKLSMYIENGYIKYPNIPEIIDELNSFEYEITKNNNITYNAPNGKHDDIVIAMALAIQLINPIPTPFIERTIYEQALEDIQIDPKTGYWK